MRNHVSNGLIRLYDHVTRAGLLNRPVPRRAFESGYLMYKRLLEAGPVGSLREVVTAGSTAIDVGANIGFFTLRFARWVGPAGHVIAIEPEARNFASLRRRVTRSGLSDIVTCVQAAAADRNGELRLALNPGHPGDHHLAADGEPVAGVRLDDLVVSDARAVTLVKIDVQGAEAMVLAGALGLIKAHRPAVLVEVHEPSLTRLGSSRREVVDSLVALGYGGHMLTRHGIGAREEPEELIARSAKGYIDVLFLPASFLG
jgi:FkbM family methyltransferase